MLTQYPEAVRGRRMLLTCPPGCPAPTSRVLAAGPGRFGRQFPAAVTPAAAPGGPRRGRGPQRAQGAAGGARGRCCGSGAKPGRQGAAPPRAAPHAAEPRRGQPSREEPWGSSWPTTRNQFSRAVLQARRKLYPCSCHLPLWCFPSV